MSNVRVRHKGQVTIPVELRQKLKIEEGSLLEVQEHKEGILLKPVTLFQGGKVVGKGANREILKELETLRKKWR